MHSIPCFPRRTAQTVSPSTVDRVVLPSVEIRHRLKSIFGCLSPKGARALTPEFTLPSVALATEGPGREP